MKNALAILYLGFFVFTNGCAFGQMPTHPWTAIVSVVGEDGSPIAGAKVSVFYTLPPTPTQDPGSENWGEIKGLTDDSGMFTASHTDSSWGLGIIAEKSGYYTTHFGHNLYVPGQFDDKTVSSNRNSNFTLLLKRIGRPTPMYAKQIESLRVPELNKPIAYDLMIGDWVGSYGKGVNSDIFFTEKHTNAQSGYILTVSFPKPGDGIQEFSSPTLVQEAPEGISDLRSAHEAPVDGYQSELAQTKMTDPNRNFYFRVRTVLDENGNVVSTHYGKIYGDLAHFRYYLNPTPNDRNIEFDPKQNLLQGMKSFEQVTAP